MFKFLVWHVLIVATSCELFAQESGYSVEYAPKYDNYQPKDYHFSYAVADPHTGDHKSQWEVKEKGVVRGGYSLLEPDGTTRIVEYIADDHGFRATVKKLGTAVHPEPVVLQSGHHPVVLQADHHSSYDGGIANYGNVGVPPILYQLQQNLGHGESVLTQSQGVGTASAVPLEQPVHTIEVAQPVQTVQEISQPVHDIGALPTPVVPIGHSYSYEQSFGSFGSSLTPTQEIRPSLPDEIQGHNLGTIKAVPLAVGHGVGRIEVDLSKIEAVPFIRSRDRVEALPITEAEWRKLAAVPLQGQHLGEIWSQAQLQGHNLGTSDAGVAKVETAPYAQGHNVWSIEAAPFQGHNLGHIGVDAGRVNAVSYAQGQHLRRIETDFGKIDGVPGQGYDINQVQAVPLAQPQIEIVHDSPQQGVSAVPVGPSGTYSTSIQYHGLTGNPDDDSQYTQDRREVYHASYSQNVPKVVPAPDKKQKLSKKDFIIYYPDSESH